MNLVLIIMLLLLVIGTILVTYGFLFKKRRFLIIGNIIIALSIIFGLIFGVYYTSKEENQYDNQNINITCKNCHKSLLDLKCCPICDAIVQKQIH